MSPARTPGTPDRLALTIPAELDGARLDLAIARLRPEISRSQAARLALDGCARVDGLPARPARRLKAGHRIELELPDAADVGLVAEDIPLKVLYRDEAIIVVDKPAGLVVHPAVGHASGTLVNALLGLDRDLRVGMAHRPGLVHRLDRDTSGLMVVARTDAAMRDLQAQWAERDVLKLYLALVVGTPKHEQATIDAPLGRDPRDRQRMAILRNGRAATTDYRVIERLGAYRLVEARIHTGRTHQIRVHFASIGHPVAGDRTYGAVAPGLARQFLHAARLGFKHPTTHEWLEMASPLPPDLLQFLAGLPGGDSLVAKGMIGQDQRRHRLNDRHGPG